MTSIRDFYLRHERWWPVLFFVLGFVYDIWSLDRIDSLFGILKQAVYLALICVLLCLEVLVHSRTLEPKGRLSKIWSYHELVVHFLLGSLLSEYTLFFFKSASLWTSFLFIGILAGLVLVNEFKRFQGHSGLAARFTLFAICFVSYFAYVVPLIFGFIGTFTFLLSLALSSTIAWLIARWLRNRLPSENDRFLLRQVYAPLGGVIALFGILYFTHLIPPVPLATQYMGIFHEVRKENGQYLLGYDPAGGSLLRMQNGARVFFARPGDRPHCFVRIFSPNRFSDQVRVRWLQKDKSGTWQKLDAIPFSISGGREQGYRGFSFKSNYTPGSWQCRVETVDGRELSRVYFTIEDDPSTTPRELTYVTQ